MATSIEIVLDAVDAEAAAGFWSQALPAEVLYRRDSYVVLQAASGLRVLVQEVAEQVADGPDGASTPEGRWDSAVSAVSAGRMHLDLRVDDPAATVERVVALGARVVRHVDERASGGSAWTVLEDPWGLPFCVAPARESVPPHPSTCR